MELGLEDKMYLICYEEWHIWYQDEHRYSQRLCCRTICYTAFSTREAINKFKSTFNNDNSVEYKILAVSDITGCNYKDFE